MTSAGDGSVPDAVRRWQKCVHDPGLYDLEVDTSILSPDAIVDAIQARLRHDPEPSALRQLAKMWQKPPEMTQSV